MVPRPLAPQGARLHAACDVASAFACTASTLPSPCYSSIVSLRDFVARPQQHCSRQQKPASWAQQQCADRSFLGCTVDGRTWQLTKLRCRPEGLDAEQLLGSHPAEGNQHISSSNGVGSSSSSSSSSSTQSTSSGSCSDDQDTGQGPQPYDVPDQASSSGNGARDDGWQVPFFSKMLRRRADSQQQQQQQRLGQPLPRNGVVKDPDRPAAEPGGGEANGKQHELKQLQLQEGVEERQGDTIEQQQAAPRPVFDIPWGGGRVAGVMALWVLAFWLNCWLLEFGLELWTGQTSGQLSTRNRAVYHVLLDINNLLLTAGILRVALRKFRPLELDCFRVRLRPLRRWWPVLACCVLFPALNWFAMKSQVFFPVDTEAWDVEDVLSAGDTVTNAIYFVLLTILAPIWEELIFRGFLLASLTKYMPPPAAVLVSSAVFALAHFSLQRSVALVLLGTILGCLFVRSRNLLHSILLHSIWNFCIFCQLVCNGAGAGCI